MGNRLEFLNWRTSLTRILLYFILNHDQFDTGMFEHFPGFLSCMVFLFGNHPGDAHADDQHRADAAWFHFAVKRASFERDPVPGSLADRILFCMNGPHAMHPGRAILLNDFLHQMPRLITMGKSRRRTNIARTDDLLVTDHDASATAPVAGCTFAHLIHQS